jgi:hypothetical protein
MTQMGIDFLLLDLSKGTSNREGGIISSLLNQGQRAGKGGKGKQSAQVMRGNYDGTLV